MARCKETTNGMINTGERRIQRHDSQTLREGGGRVGKDKAEEMHHAAALFRKAAEDRFRKVYRGGTSVEVRGS